MDLRQLRYFLAVAEDRHFGRAADRLGIAQPGLSQQIKALERLIGEPLFDRNVRPVALTPAGEALLPQARIVIEAVQRALEVTRERPHAVQGTLRFGTPLVGHFPVVRKLVGAVCSGFPDVDLRLHPGLSVHNLHSLSQGGLDVAVVHVPFESQRKPHYLRLGAHEIVVVLPPGHRLAGLDRIPRSELLKDRFLDWPRIVNPPVIDHVRRALFGVESHPRSVEIGVALDGASRAILVAEGKGFSADAVPFPVGQLPEGDGVVYCRVEEPAPLVEHGLVWFETSPLMETFLETAREIVRSSESPSTEEGLPGEELGQRAVS